MGFVYQVHEYDLLIYFLLLISWIFLDMQAIFNENMLISS